MPMELHGSGFESLWLQYRWGHNSMVEPFHRILSSHWNAAESLMGIEIFIKDALHNPK